MTYDYFEVGPPTQSRFALRLRMVRSAAGLTPQALAADAEIAFRRYQAYESGRLVVTAAALLRLARALQVEPALFFDPD